jgi:fructose-bisphosphate aldolase class II
VSGAQHGTSGNSSDRLIDIATRTRTTKANVATALQMISWGLEVNDYGNAILDESGGFIKVKGQGATEEMWQAMIAFAEANGLKGGNFKKLNLPFENKLLGQPAEIRERMSQRVENFAHDMITKVFNAFDTAPMVIDAILIADAYDPGSKIGKIENASDWTLEKITAKAATFASTESVEGDFDD